MKVAEDIGIKVKWMMEESPLLSEHNYAVESTFEDMCEKNELERAIVLKNTSGSIAVLFSCTLKDGSAKGTLSNDQYSTKIERRLLVNNRLCKLPQRNWRIQFQSVITYLIDKNLPVYNEIATEFRKLKVKEFEVTVIQNLPLYTNYYYECLAIDAKGTNRNERLLYHGSKVNPEILWRFGFNVKYSSDKNLWGQGIYFANNVDYAHKYAFRDEHGYYYLILCQVALGESFFYGNLCNPGLKYPPRRCDIELKPDDAVMNYDSVQGRTNDGTVQVIYNVDQIYPAYVVKYKSDEVNYLEGVDVDNVPIFH